MYLFFVQNFVLIGNLGELSLCFPRSVFCSSMGRQGVKSFPLPSGIHIAWLSMQQASFQDKVALVFGRQSGVDLRKGEAMWKLQ